jgi:hypothetical protein
VIGTVFITKPVGSYGCIVECGIVIIAAFIIGIAVERVICFKPQIQINLSIAGICRKQ